MLDFSQFAWGIDIGPACTKYNFKPFVKAGGTFAWNKIGEYTTVNPQWAPSVQAMYDDGVQVRGGYWEVSPLYYLNKTQDISKCTVKTIDTFLPVENDEQIQALISGILNKDIQMIGLAVEETNGMRDSSKNGWISTIGEMFLDRVRKHVLPLNPHIKVCKVYTRQSFIDSISPNMKVWMAKEQSCWGAFFINNGGIDIADWANFKNYLPHQLFWGHENPPYCYCNAPVSATQNGDWWMLQHIGDGFRSQDFLGANGQVTFVDGDIYHGTEAQMLAEMQLTTQPPVVVIPPDEPPVIVTPPDPTLAALQAQLTTLSNNCAQQGAELGTIKADLLTAAGLLNQVVQALQK